MPINWGLRRILGVNPGDRTCVGDAPSKNRRSGPINKRCTKPINKHDWPAACQLLDQMDRLEDLRDAIEDLEELAGLLLCNEVHNSLSRPQHSQVDKMYRKWKGIVEEYVRLWEQEDGAAERQAQRLRQGEKEREALREALREAERGSIATEVITELEEEQLDKVRTARSLSALSATSDVANIDDPFLTQEDSSSRPNIFTQFAPTDNNEEGDAAEEDDGVSSGKFSSEEENELSVREMMRPELPYMLPPLTHDEPSSPTQNHRIAIAEQQETGSATATDLKASSMAKFALKFGPGSAGQVPFLFETPIKFKATHGEIPSSSGTTSFTAFSDSSFSMLTTSTSTTPEKETPKAPERIPLKEKVVKPINKALLTNSGSSTYEFGSGGEKQFQFEAPITPRKSSVLNHSSTHSGYLFKLAPSDGNQEAASTSSQPSERSELPDIASPAPINEPYANDFVAQPITSPRNNEESFGYANVTPNSTRYTTYLPARQQYGLITPPETPEMLMGALTKPMGGAGYFRDERSREDGSPNPRITRKPLPRSPPPQLEAEGEGPAGICAACGRECGQEAGDCNCGEGCDDEVGSRAGCLERFGFWRLKQRVVGRLAVVRGRISRTNGNEILRSSNENL
ncbi:hypothetical protein BGZ57DRAFT_991362 [Hyaloscypha finlandica]|nr:hypothetical protein BGZ57DRAFT_991362 [Hyaloscypha finlandica]